MSLKGGAHNGFLAFADGGRHQHGTLPCRCEVMFHGGLSLFFCEAAGALYLQLCGSVEQEAVANGGVGLSGVLQAEPHTEEIRMLSFGEKSARVVGEVVYPALQLAVLQQDAVVVASFEQKSAFVASMAWL